METYYIYLITNKINGKNYVGQRRLRKYKRRVVTPLTDGYMGSGKYIIRAENKYGINNFDKEILAICHSSKEIDILETSYISLYKSIGKAEYNIAEGGHGYSLEFLTPEEKLEIRKKIIEKLNSSDVKKKMSNSHIGKPTWNKSIPMKNESKEKLSNSLLKQDCSEKSKRGWITRKKNGYTLSEEHKQALINSNLGKKRSEEIVNKIAEKNKGKKRTEEQKERMRISRLKYWENREFPEERKKILSEKNKGKIPWIKGKHHSDESKRKISESLLGEKNHFYGKHHSEETKQKLREIGKLRTVSPETRKKISESMKRHRQSMKEKNNGIIQ